MSKELKELMTRELSSRYAGLQDCLIVNYTRVTASEADELRTELRQIGVRMQVVKNRLGARAFQEIGLSDLCALLKGPSAIVHGPDIVSACKLVVKWSRDHEKLEIRGGLLGRKGLTANEAKRLAELPSAEALRQRAASLVLSPITGILYAVRSVHVKIATALDAIRKRKEQESQV
jgi:large subunit ribosomal protein L10